MEIVEVVTSTMDLAREQVQAGRVGIDADGRPDSEGILARVQTGGRGQRGRSWFSAPGASLCATYFVGGPGVDPSTVSLLSLGAGVAVAHAIGDIAGASGPPVGLKWPNDILLSDRKVAGILLEMVKAPSGRWIALVGVGINVGATEFPPDIRDTATSLANEGIAVASCDALAVGIGALLRRWSPSEAAGILHSWRELDVTHGRRFEAEVGSRTLTGEAVGIDDHGALLLRLEDGRTVAVSSASSLREV